MLNVNCSVFSAVTDKAMQDAAGHPRWLTAINRAVVECLSNPYMERQDGSLLIASSSGTVYAANGTCQCTAFSYGQPCWHRAAARLVRLHDEKVGGERQAREQELDEYERYLAAQTERWAKAQAEMDELYS